MLLMLQNDSAAKQLQNDKVDHTHAVDDWCKGVRPNQQTNQQDHQWLYQRINSQK
jgi:hypothetical protein